MQDGLEKRTEKQRRFLTYYSRERDITSAAKRAGYTRAYAMQLLKDPEIQEILRGMESDQGTLEHRVEDVLRMYEKMAFSNVCDFLRFGTREENGRRKSYVELRGDKEVDGELIEEIVISSSGVPRIKLYDKLKALEKLERYYDMLPDRWKREIEEKKLLAAQKDKEGTVIEVTTCVPRPKEEADGKDCAAH